MSHYSSGQSSPGRPNDLPEIHPVLLCGGSGTRLWPLSRKSYPKQFARLIGPHSLFAASALRLSGPGFAAPMVVTGSDFRFIVTEQLASAEIAPSAILLEPAARNTAPAICAAALALEARSPGTLMLVAPSDHVIPDGARFQNAVRSAVPAALDGALVTFGIRPTRPETGYGWLELATPHRPDQAPAACPLRSFVEKPDRATATQLLQGGRHLWNAGIFLFTTTSILQAFRDHAPQILDGTKAALANAQSDLGFMRLAADPWAALDDISIDFAVMEQAQNLNVVPYDGVWSDLGDWEAVWREGDPDSAGTVLHGPTTSIDCHNTLLHAQSTDQELVGIGLHDIVAVAMPDAVLIAHKDRTQDVKLAVQQLKDKNACQAETSPRDFRPWGWFESLVLGNRFQVKRIVVNPGAALSLQSHHHRAEHWIVVEGTARVTIADSVQLVTENQSVYIPVGTAHRLENPGKVPMVLIEVQTGSYLGEDDIIRHEDLYARDRQGGA